MITQTKLATRWHCRQSYVSKLVAKGMPLTSEKDALEWRSLHSKRHSATIEELHSPAQRKASRADEDATYLNDWEDAQTAFRCRLLASGHKPDGELLKLMDESAKIIRRVASLTGLRLIDE